MGALLEVGISALMAGDRIIAAAAETLWLCGTVATSGVAPGGPWATIAPAGMWFGFPIDPSWTLYAVDDEADAAYPHDIPIGHEVPLTALIADDPAVFRLRNSVMVGTVRRRYTTELGTHVTLVGNTEWGERPIKAITPWTAELLRRIP